MPVSVLTHKKLPAKRPFIVETGKQLGALGGVFIEEDGRSLPRSDVETHHQHSASPPALAQCSVLWLWL